MSTGRTSELFVVRESGRQSKPSSRANILEAYKKGLISEAATVLETASGRAMPIGDFIGESEFLAIDSSPPVKKVANKKGRRNVAAVPGGELLPRTDNGVRLYPATLLFVIATSLLAGCLLTFALVDYRQRQNLADRPRVDADSDHVDVPKDNANVGMPAPQAIKEPEPVGEAPQQPVPPPAAVAAPVAGFDPLEAVRAFLRESTHTGRWEEVRTWPPLELTTVDDWIVLDQVRYRYYRALFEAPPNDVYTELSKLQRNYASLTTPCFLRMKFRAQNGFGATVLADQVFLVSPDGVYRTGVNDLLVWGWDYLASHPDLTEEDKFNARDPLGGNDTPMRQFFDQFLQRNPQQGQQGKGN